MINKYRIRKWFVLALVISVIATFFNCITVFAEEYDDEVLDKAFEAYKTVISENEDQEEFLATFENEKVWDGTNVYKYALVSLSVGQKIPTLAICHEFIYHQEVDFTYDAEGVHFYQFDEESNEVIRLNKKGIIANRKSQQFQQLNNGEAVIKQQITGKTAGRWIILMLMDGQKFIFYEAMNVLDGVREETEWVGYHPVEWYDASDMSGFDNWQYTEFTDDICGINEIRKEKHAEVAAEQANQETTAVQADDSNPPTDGNRTVLSGTVMQYDYNGIQELQGRPDPNNYPTSNIWTVIILDTPQVITAMSGDASALTEGEVYCIVRDNNPIAMNDTATLENYVGQHVIFSIDPNITFFPGGVSLPLGQPSTWDIKILD